MGEPNFIGNIKSKEFHRNNCPFLKHIYNVNQRPFHSVTQATKEGYDRCGHCLPTTTRGPENPQPSEVQYFGKFYGIFNGIPYVPYSVPKIDCGQDIELFVELHKAVFENDSWTIVPIENHKIDISCDTIDFSSAQTNSDGLASWSYTLPMDFEPGDTRLLATPNLNNLSWDSNGIITFEVPLQIEIVENIPEEFDQETKIVFKLSKEKQIKADIYRGSSENEYSHICSLRKFSDGPLPAGEAFFEWDGTADHGLWKGKAVKRGLYKVVLQGENGESDRDELFMFKKKGILAGEDPEPNEPNEYVTNLVFSRNPFSSRTNVSIGFELLKPAKVSIHIQHIEWNFIEKCVKEIILDKNLTAGNHTYVWDGTNNSEIFQAGLGKYKVRLRTNDESFVKKGLWKKAHWNL